MRMSKIVTITADLLPPFILAFGLYVIAHGHLTPGGGFQGGAVTATGLLLLIVAYSYKDIAAAIRQDRFKLYESLGLIIVIGVGYIAFLYGATFFTNWLVNTPLPFGTYVPFGPNPGDLNTGGTMPLYNIFVGVEVFCGLTIVVLYMLSGLEEGEGSS